MQLQFFVFPYFAITEKNRLKIYGFYLQSDTSSVEIGSLDATSVRSLERHFVLRLTSGQLPSIAFHTLMDFILHVMQPK